MALECICGEHMLEPLNEGTCLKCGHGDVTVLLTRENRRTGESDVRLPRDLGGLAREGRRPDPRSENVVRLDRLRPSASTAAEELAA